MTEKKDKYNIKKSETEYFMIGLSIFQEMRYQGKDLLNTYIGRLISEASPFSKELGGEAKAQTSSASSFRIANYVKRIANIGIKIYNFVKLVRPFYIQKKYLARARANSEATCSAVIAFDSKRLDSAKNDEPRAYLASLAKSFPCQRTKSGVADVIHEAQYIFVFDSNSLSSLWQKREKCWQEDLFIIDAYFLSFLVIVSRCKEAVLSAYRYARGYPFFQTPCSKPMSYREALKSAVVMSMVIEGYKEILGASRNVRSFFFTANSFLTEILRIYLIQDKRCIEIAEILHGVSAPYYERYLASLLQSGVEYCNGNGTKHYFIPQIPNFPSFGIYKTYAEPVEEGEMVVINAHLNKYFFEHKDPKIDFMAFAEAEYKVLFAECPFALEANTLIVSFVGASAYEIGLDYFASDCFQVERLIMLHVKRILDSIGQPFIMVYTPHPIHRASKEFSEFEFFSKNRVIVYPRTIFTWFVSDLCISLHSSVLFEATYFGVKSFTPMLPSDEIFPSLFLNLLNFSERETRNDFVDRLDDFILAYANRGPVDVLHRAKERLALIEGEGSVLPSQYA